MSKILIIVLVVVGVLALGGAGFAGYKMLYARPTSPVPLPMVKTPAATLPVAKPVSQITLQITQPTNGQVLSAATVNVTGKTVANADVSVNDKDVKADAAGNFSAAVNLDEGDNPIMVTAFDADGSTSEQELTVTYQPAGQ